MILKRGSDCVCDRDQEFRRDGTALLVTGSAKEEKGSLTSDEKEWTDGASKAPRL